MSGNKRTDDRRERERQKAKTSEARISKSMGEEGRGIISKEEGREADGGEKKEIGEGEKERKREKIIHSVNSLPNMLI